MNRYLRLDVTDRRIALKDADKLVFLTGVTLPSNRPQHKREHETDCGIDESDEDEDRQDTYAQVEDFPHAIFGADMLKMVSELVP